MFKTSMLCLRRSLPSARRSRSDLVRRCAPRFRRLPWRRLQRRLCPLHAASPAFPPALPHRPHVHVRWQRPLIYGVGTTAVAAPAYAAVAACRRRARPCTCLSKEYTPDNLVVFKDRCTKEMAAAPIGGPQQQGQAQPERATGGRRGRADGDEVSKPGRSASRADRRRRRGRPDGGSCTQREPRPLAGFSAFRGIKLLYRVAFLH